MSWQTKKAISLIDVLPKDKLLKSPKFSPLNQPSCGVGNMSALNLGRVGTPIPQENLGCFFICQSIRGMKEVGQTCQNCGHNYGRHW